MNARAAFSRSEAALEYRPVPTLDGSHAWHWVLLALPHKTCLGTGTAPNRAQAGTQARLKARQVGRRIAQVSIAGGALKEAKLPVPVNARDFILQKPARRACCRCGSWLDAEDYCEDETCPFSDHRQPCPLGWAGHPKQLSHRGVNYSPDCTCGGRVRQEESVDPKDFILQQKPGEDTPCGEPCGLCGKPCTLVHRGTGRDSLVAGEHICQACDCNRFAGMLPENVSPEKFIDYAQHAHEPLVQEATAGIVAKDFIMQQQTPEERLSKIATPGKKSSDLQAFRFDKTWPTTHQVSVLINLYKNSSPGGVTVWVRVYSIFGRLIEREEDEHCYQDQDECLDRLIPILQQIESSEQPVDKNAASHLFEPLFTWMYQTSGKI